MAKFTPMKSPKPIEVDKFLGLNESFGDTEVSLGEAIYMRNFNITNNLKLRKRTGHSTLADFSLPAKSIQGMWHGTIGGADKLLAVVDSKLYNIGTHDVEALPTPTNIGTFTVDAPTSFFYFGSKLYMMNGTDYKEYDGTTFRDVTPYVPLIYSGTAPAGTGATLVESINLLTGKKRQKFVGDNTATAYYIAEQAIDATLVTATVNGAAKVENTDFTVNRTTGVITFTVAPGTGAMVEIQWEKASSSNMALVKANKYATTAGPGNDTTVFLYGNPNQKNRRTHSAIPLDGSSAATYFPADNFVLVGTDQTAITSIVTQYDTQIIFKEDSTFYSKSEYLTILSKYDYPVYDLNSAVGNVTPNGAQIIENYPVSLCGQSVWKWSSTNIKDERNASTVSDKVRKSLASLNLATAITFDYQAEKELWINVGSLVYIWNYGNDAWYVYDNIEATCFIEAHGVVYYGTKTGKVERFITTAALGTDDNGTAINAVWKSGFTDFGAYEYRKTSRSMWFAIQPASKTSVDIKVATSKVNEDDPNIKTFTKGYNLMDFDNIDFDDFSFLTNRNPQAFRIKIKAKKYAYMQVIISNSKPNESLVFLSYKVMCDIGSFNK